MSGLQLVRGAAADGRSTLAVSGEIDLGNVDRLHRALEGEGGLIVDLAGVTYMDSAGMAALFARAARGGLEVRIRGGSVMEPLVEITRLSDVAEVRKD